MRNLGGAMYAIAGLIAIGALISGFLLLTHSVQDCTGLFCTPTHPFVGAGAAVLVGGLINGGIIAVVGYLCEMVADLRDYRNADAALVLEQMDGEPPEAPTMYGRRD